MDLDQLEAVARAATQGEWHTCGADRGGCSCVTVMASDFPIAMATSGDWGDSYPSIRLVGESSLDLRAEAYMEQMTYGNVPPEEGKANAAHIGTFDPPTVLALIAVAKAAAELVEFPETTKRWRDLRTSLANLSKMGGA